MLLSVQNKRLIVPYYSKQIVRQMKYFNISQINCAFCKNNERNSQKWAIFISRKNFIGIGNKIDFFEVTKDCVSSFQVSNSGKFKQSGQEECIWRFF